MGNIETELSRLQLKEIFCYKQRTSFDIANGPYSSSFPLGTRKNKRAIFFLNLTTRALMRFSTALTAFILFIESYLFGNDIIKDRHAFSFSASYETYRTSHFWNKNGVIKPAFNQFHSTEYRSYIEYGLTSKNTLGAQFAWEKITESLHGHAMGFTEVELTWKHVLYKHCSSTIAGQVIGIIPIINDFKPGLRYGRYGSELAVFYIRDFKYQHFSWWYDLKGGYRFYKGFPSDQLRSHVRVCCLFDCRIQLSAGAFLEYGIFNGKHMLISNIIADFPNYRLLKAEFEACYRIFKNVYASVGYCQRLWGNNVGTGGSFIASLGYAF